MVSFLEHSKLKQALFALMYLFKGVQHGHTGREGWERCGAVQAHHEDSLRAEDQICAGGIHRPKMHNYNRTKVPHRLCKKCYTIYTILPSLFIFLGYSPEEAQGKRV